MPTEDLIEVDGSQGEGGGQILRSCLALSVITGRPFRITKIRARRRTPGLLRQHLTAVLAAKAVSHADVEGAELRSDTVRFVPRDIVGGAHRFVVGTAGSSTLVLQTVLWPLILAPTRSTLRLEGGTHNPMAPPYDFIERTLVPVLRTMGAEIDIQLVRHGFYPAGGGAFEVTIEGGRPLKPIELMQRGPLSARRAVAVVANLSAKIAKRELSTLSTGLGLAPAETQVQEVSSDGPGNVVMLELESDHVSELVTGFGERHVRAEEVARRVVEQALVYLDAGVPVGAHLADQLLIPLALAGGGRFLTLAPTLHTTTNAKVIERFLDVSVETAEHSDRGFVVQITRRA